MTRTLSETFSAGLLSAVHDHGAGRHPLTFRGGEPTLAPQYENSRAPGRNAMKTTVCSLLVLGFSTVALAQDKGAPPAGAPDMTKMGPLSRKVTREDKKGIDALYKATEDAWKKGDVNALADMVDFPVIMLSDDSKGEVKHFAATREQWMGMMQQFVQGMPKDAQMKHKQTAYFLSDDLAVAIEDHSMSMGKVKGSWKAMSVLTLRDGKWKFKEMAEAGWGDMKPPAGATTAQTMPPKK
jgi:ketosteroid isomerase-like protein